MTDKLNISYKILQYNESDRSIVVRYFTDFLSEDELDARPYEGEKREDGSPKFCRTDYNLNIWDHIKTEEELHTFILNCAPVDWFTNQYKQKNGESHPLSDIIRKHENSTFSKEVLLTVNSPNSDVLTEEEIDNLILKLANSNNTSNTEPVTTTEPVTEEKPKKTRKKKTTKSE